jgi:hypothetical protein
MNPIRSTSHSPDKEKPAPSPYKEDVKYLGLNLDRRLAGRKYIFTERKQLGMALTKMYWLLGHEPKLHKQ